MVSHSSSVSIKLLLLLTAVLGILKWGGGGGVIGYDISWGGVKWDCPAEDIGELRSESPPLSGVAAIILACEVQGNLYFRGSLVRYIWLPICINV